jgi:hypothetical protein
LAISALSVPARSESKHPMPRQAEQRGLNLVLGPADGQSALSQFVECGFEIKLAIENAIGVGDGHRDGEDFLGHGSA